MIRRCRCTSDYCDEQYGAGNRPHNEAPGGTRPPQEGWRCAICGKKTVLDGPADNNKDDKRKTNPHQAERTKGTAGKPAPQCKRGGDRHGKGRKESK